MNIPPRPKGQLPAPGDHVGWHERGNALFAQGDFPAAIACYEHVSALAPALPNPHDNRGLALQRMGRFSEALAAHDAAIRCDPAFAPAHSNRATTLREFGRFDEALEAARRALALAPGNPAYRNGLGVALSDLGRSDEALAEFRAAIAGDPRMLPARNNLADVLRDLGRADESVEELDRVLAAAPRYARAHANRALALQELARFDEALHAYDAALALQPLDHEARKRRATLHLLRGDFDAGWRDYEASAQAARARQQANGATGDAPPWLGQPLAGRSILLSEPNGLGDAIQYWRLVPALLAAGAKPVFAGQARLHRLLASSGFDIGFADVPPSGIRFDFRSELWAVACGLRFDPRAHPPQRPYLEADPVLVAKWRPLAREGAINIGIAWQGKQGRRIDAGRSIPLAAFEPLARVPGVRLVSLQRGAGTEQLAQLPDGMAVLDPGPAFDAGPDAFADTAALMASLDLVVTSDTAIAHVAGALGRPAWVALRHVPEWRWMLERDDSPWYPTLRLFRQPAPGAWDAVFAAMATALRQPDR
jgi:tetratricopeptide (TPR) repeat protein